VLSLLLPTLLTFLFNTVNPINNFINIISQLSCRGGSSYINSSYVDKAPAIPKKRINKAFSSKKWKYLKITVNTTDLKSLIYYEFKFKSKLKFLLLRLINKLK